MQRKTPRRSILVSVFADLRHLRRIHAATIDLDPGEARLDLAKVRWRELDVDRARVPRDVLQHQCIGFRHRGESKYRWEFDKGGQSMAISVSGSLLVDDLDLVIQAALDGAGLAWVAEDRVAPFLASGALVRVLEDWCPPFPGFFLYYPTRKQQPAALTALITTLRM